jgi:glycine/D-amino acid oxidase-like deaminating enzyme/nitrite reductase/ring-hydroxylating ferredoxin subunit
VGSKGIGEAGRADRVSFWMASTEASARRSLTASLEADVAVVGGGIVGLTTALLLARSGRSVVVLEAEGVAAGVSGYTTAKVTAGHGLIYSHLESTLGADAARMYAESQLAGLSFVSDLCVTSGIQCDLEAAANYLVVESEDEIEKLDAELDAAQTAGLAVRRVTDLGAVPFPAVGAVELGDQAQFHVRKYLLAVAALIEQAGGRIFECSRVTEISGGGPYVIRGGAGVVHAAAVVVGSHYPIVEQGFFVTRIHPRRSYVVAAPVTGDVPEGMFINAGPPARSVRTAPLEDGRRLLLVGGEGHRVGQQDRNSDPYPALERFMREHFSVGQTMFRWSTQDNHSVDRLPYIGRMGDEGDLYVATGFAGWGMTNGTMAALTISDAIQGRVKPWASLYDPDRHDLAAAAKSFLTENTNIAVQQLKEPLADGALDSVEEISPGQGAIVAVDGAEVAVSRDLGGGLHALSAACTHMGCSVSWNDAESTWDCPCHGSRFAVDGRVLHGPALHQLEPVAIKAPEETN